MCTVDSSWFLFGLTAAVLMGCCGWLLRRRAFGSINLMEDAPAYQEDQLYERVIPNEPYLREAVRLAKNFVSELAAGVASYEKKALAAMIIALALVGFMLTRGWCFNIAEVFRVISIGAGIAAIFSAVRAMRSCRIGIIGLPPMQVMQFWLDIQVSAAAGCRNEGGGAESSSTRADGESMEKCQLYTMLLRRYQQAAEISRQAIKEKAKQFVFSAHCLFVSFFAAIAWLFMTLAQQLV